MFGGALVTPVHCVRKSSIKPLKQDAERFLVNNKNTVRQFLSLDR